MNIDEDTIHEAFELWPAYMCLHSHLLSTDVRLADPRDLAGPLAHYGHVHAACLLYAHGHGATLEDSARIAGHLQGMCENGERPRYCAELGITLEDLIGGGSDGTGNGSGES